MADTKISALTALTGANSAPADLLPIVDVSDTTMAASGTTKAITREEFQTFPLGAITTDRKIADYSATWNAAGVSFTGFKMNVTNTASAVTSMLFDLHVGGSRKVGFDKSGRLLFPLSGSYIPRIEVPADYTIALDMNASVGEAQASSAYKGFNFELSGASCLFGTNSLDTYFARAGANSVRWGGTTPAATTTSRTEINKAVASIADNTATATFTVTVPNAAHSAMLKVTLVGSLGAGGAVGANEATGTISYDFAIARTAGVATVVTPSTAYGSATSAVAGAATITVTAAASAVSGANSATQTFTVNVTIARGSGSSTNHTCLCYGRLLNANATGITIA